MKKLLTLLLVFTLIQGGMQAQDMLGFRSSNYSGIQSLGINPALIHNSRFNLDVNIIGVGATIENNFIFLPKDKLKFFGIKNVINKFNDKQYLDKFEFKKAEDTYNASAAITIMGPGVMFNIKNKHTLAITTQLRSAISANGIQGHIGKYAVEGLTYDPLHSNEFNAQGFQMNILSWIEYGLSYATTLTEK